MHRLQDAGMKPRIPAATNNERALGDKESSALKINALLSEVTTRLVSGESPRSESVHIEHHKASPYEKAPSTSANHLIALFQDHVSRGESAVVPGHFVPFSYFPGTVNLYSQGPLPACRSFGEMTMIVCALDPKFIYEVGKEIETPSIIDFPRTTNFRDRPLGGLVALLTTETQFGGSSGRLYLDYLAHALALRFLWVVGNDRDANFLPDTTLQFAMPRHLLRRVIDRMKSDLSIDLTLSTLAAESGYSRAHFLRMFRAAVGKPPHQYLLDLRLGEAERRIRAASTPLIEIAMECGFSSHSHLSKAFRHRFGVTPSRYRRNI